MSIRNLEYLFRPQSLVVVGASERPASVGGAVTRNILAGGFQGRIALVNPAHDSLAGQRAYARISSLDFVPDLAVICTPPATIPKLIAQLGERGTRAAIIISAGMHDENAAGVTHLQAALNAARPHLLRILGPNCVGMLSPGIGLNASFAHNNAYKGSLAFVSQSGALTTGLLDWARSRSIGFSHFISIGEAADIDFGSTDWPEGPGCSTLPACVSCSWSMRPKASAGCSTTSRRWPAPAGLPIAATNPNPGARFRTRSRPATSTPIGWGDIRNWSGKNGTTLSRSRRPGTGPGPSANWRSRSWKPRNGGGATGSRRS